METTSLHSKAVTVENLQSSDTIFALNGSCRRVILLGKIYTNI